MAEPKGFGQHARRLRCPECSRKGVTLRLRNHGEDGWGCRYCTWWAYTSGEDRTDVVERRRLAMVNPDQDIHITDLPDPTPESHEEP